MLGMWIVISNLINLVKKEEGQGLVEYSLLFLMVVLILIAALATLGSTINTVFYEKLASDLFGA